MFPALLLPLEWCCGLLFALTGSLEIEGARQMLLLAGTASALFPLLTGIGAYFSLPRTGGGRGQAALHGLLQLLALSGYAVFARALWNNEPLPLAPGTVLAVKAGLLALLFAGSRIAGRLVRARHE
ncbi:MAG: hypothetical protein EOO11_17535 [Chitinophagaceae bacterium]|nr:MAG: hypothetical protein EOO11_17535 [Chitinophagaceae bacterium]